MTADATPLLRLYARWRQRRLAAEDAARVQQAQLLRLVRAARRTAFGRAHDFARIGSVGAYQARVPLRRYEEFWRDWWQPAFPVLEDVTWPGRIPFFAATSGTTTGATKYIPVSAAMIRANRAAALDVLVHHVARHPASRILGGPSLVLGGSTDLVRQAPGVRSGDLSGIAAITVPPWARRHYFPPRDIALLSDWDRKTDLMARASLSADIRSISGTPSWVLPFLAKAAALGGPGAGVRDIYPHLELFVHGGVDFRPYRSQFESLFAGMAVSMREVYPASEGFVAVADREYGEGLRLLLDNGLFMEFVPAEAIGADDPPRFWLGNVRPDVNYAIVLTSNAGLWSYVLGDTVRFVSLDPPRILFTGRLAHTLSAFGEHLIVEEIESAVGRAAEEAGAAVTEFTVAPRFPTRPDERGRHCFVVEPADPGRGDWRRFARSLDAALCAENADYEAHRAGMEAPDVIIVKAGAFAGWMRARGRHGGQNKVPRVINDPAMFDALLAFLDSAGLVAGRVSGTARP